MSGEEKNKMIGQRTIRKIKSFLKTRKGATTGGVMSLILLVILLIGVGIPLTNTVITTANLTGLTATVVSLLSFVISKERTSALLFAGASTILLILGIIILTNPIYEITGWQYTQNAGTTTISAETQNINTPLNTAIGLTITIMGMFGIYMGCRRTKSIR